MQARVMRLAAAAALLLAAQVSAAPPETGDRIIACQIDAAIDRAIAEKRLVGAVVLVASDGKIVYRRAAGLADREAATPMRENTLFRLASVSKPLATAAAMRLVEQGKLGLEDPVTRWLPAFRPRLADGSEPTITIRQLLTHTSGLSYGLLQPVPNSYRDLGVSDGMDSAKLSLTENVERLSQAPLFFQPGSAWRYSLSIDVLGAVIEKAAGAPLPQLVADMVTKPLGMADTAFSTREAARLAVPYANTPAGPARMTEDVEVPDGVSAVRFAPSRATNADAFASAGAGMVGTAGDFLRFLEAIRLGGSPIFRPDTVAAMVKDQVGAQAATQGPGWGFGYGWAVLSDRAAAQTPQSNGTIRWGGAYGHSWFVDPARSLSVVAMTNTTFEGMNGQFTVELRDAVYGR